ncbi:ATP-dependent DNA helicase RecQ [Peribacillus cavernae]|uniref:ATP-dependent DNA helicase RecQ n=1 Tax=Peribacillus cavernae TaxID=1674310 RepID=A0A3S0W7A0_9BACI|nr:RecQ family ATP-dependent DNA helicase [Peribacillus cavernae]MDQ0219022.1 ATP-dependent DNA helicase RecQ [Peribacillus cavernae]RUQ29272.1 ATP-dependent DNA helicase RecQ [Peribacillus cavernae]
MNLEKQLHTHFGFNTFRPGQKEIISSLLNGQHTLGMLATGTGKSLCYQLTGYILKKPVLIVSPLLSLMQDQAEQLKHMGEKSVLTLNSFLEREQKREAIQNITRYRFIFLSPEMLAVEGILNALRNLDIGLFVIDEAHCISQWGYDFRPDYLQLGNIRRKLSNPLTLALTATATEEVREDISDRLDLDTVHQVISSVDRGNIALAVETFSGYEEKLQRLLEITRESKGPGIIYFSSKKAAENTALYLKENGIAHVAYYHGGMEQEQRMLIQQQFITGQLRVICSTSAFGMGVNKENVRFVVHFHLPSGIEAYVQETGRAGRDGNQSAAIILYCEGDEGLPLHLMEQELPTEPQIDGVFSYVDFSKFVSEKPPVAVQEAIIQQFSLSEIQWRFIQHFIGLNRGQGNVLKVKEAMKRYVSSRKEYKTAKIYSFLTWLISKQCRREGVLNYFQEEKKSQNERCCDRCGLDPELLQNMSANGSELAASRFTNWKQDLAKLLLKAADSNEK